MLFYKICANNKKIKIKRFFSKHPVVYLLSLWRRRRSLSCCIRERARTHTRRPERPEPHWSTRVPSSSSSTPAAAVLLDQGATRRIEIVLSDERSTVRTASTYSNGASATSHQQQQPQQQYEQKQPQQLPSSYIVTASPTLSHHHQQPPYFPQARKSISLSHASTALLAAHFANGHTNKSTAMSQERDRLGLLGVGDHDAEVTGALSGLQRLTTARYNKVSDVCASISIAMETRNWATSELVIAGNFGSDAVAEGGSGNFHRS